MSELDIGMGDSSRVTTFQLYQKLVDLERAQERRMADVSSDIRAVRQTIDENLAPTLVEHEGALEALRARFIYALTIIGSALGAIVFLFFRAGGGI